MSQKKSISHDDLALFKQAAGSATKLQQDTIFHRPSGQKKVKQTAEAEQAIRDADFYFSDEYQGYLGEKQAGVIP